MIKKSTVIDLFASFVSQEFDIFVATSKQIFESTMIFETIISSKNSHFTFNISEIASKSMKNESNQCFSVSLFLFSQMFQSERQKFAIQKLDDENSLFKIFSNKSICEDEKNSVEIQKQKKIQKIIDRLVKNSHFSINAIDFVREIEKTSFVSHKSKSTKKSTTCRRCNQIFNFNNKFHEHIREQHARKSVKNLNFRVFISEFAYKIIEKSTDISFVSFISQKSFIFFATSKNLTSNTETFLQFVSTICSNFSIATFKISFKNTKTISITHVRAICKRCAQNFNFNNKFYDHIRQQHVRKSVKNSDFRIFASEFTFKFIEKSASICSSVSFVSQKSFIFFTTSKNQIFWLSINFESIIASMRSNLSITTYKISSKSLKSVVVNCSHIFSISFSQISISKYQKSHNEFYFTVNDLNRMFHEKFKSFDLRQYHCYDTRSNWMIWN